MGNDPNQHTLWSIPGDGVLARQGGLVLLVSIDDHGFTESLLDLLARVSEDGGDGRDLAEAIGAQVEGHRSWGGAEAGPAVVSFGPAGGGTAFAVSGTACVDLSTPHGTERLAVAHPSMVLKSTVGVPVRSIRAALDRTGSSQQTDRFTRLDGGTVRAGGLSCYSAEPALAGPTLAGPVPTATSPAGTVPAAAATPAGPPGDSGPDPDPDATDPVLAVYEPSAGVPDAPDYGFSPDTLVGTVLPALKPPAPGPPTVAGRPPASAPIVPGIYCENGHFTDPDGQSCVICGTWIRERPEPRPGPRPPLGLLVLDNGATLPVDGDYVIGRDPGQDQSVSAGAARPLRIADAKQTVSRLHARIQLDGWRVLITDLGSANGTHLQARDGQMPLLLEPRVPVPVVPGARIFVGAPCLRYERSVDGNHMEKGL